MVPHVTPLQLLKISTGGCAIVAICPRQAGVPWL
jgi:hypothetical protein